MYVSAGHGGGSCCGDGDGRIVVLMVIVKNPSITFCLLLAKYSFFKS